MGLTDILIAVGIIAAVIAGIRRSDKEAREWVRLIEMMQEDERRERENQKKEGDTDGEEGAGTVHRCVRADQGDGKGY